MRRSGYRWRALAACALLVGLAAVHPAGVRAATDTVGTCDESTLRSVISGAAAGDTVTFTCSGTITLTSGGGGAITLSKNLTIDGSGAPGPVTISGGNSVRVFAVNSGVSVTLNDLTIANGNAGTVNGAGTGNGGGIENFGGALTVTNSTFSGNSAGGDNGGGGIFNLNGKLTVSNSTFSGNSAHQSGSGAGGGGIASAGGTVMVSNSTFSTNTATNGGGIDNVASTLSVTNSTFSANSADAFGGGIDNVGTLSVTNSTFSANSASAGGGIYTCSPDVCYSDGSSSTTLANTILAGSHFGGDCYGAPITDHGGNLADNKYSCGITQVLSTTLQLGALAPNGGPTQTIALGAGSVAIDYASANCPSTDQRGAPRPDPGDAGVTTNCDSGAYESQVTPQDLTVSTSATPSFSRTFSWGLTKGVDTTSQSIPAGGSATFHYSVDVTHDAGTDSGWQVNGSITVHNPNGSDVSGVTVTDATDNGGTCSVTNGANVTVPANGSLTVSYSCSYAAAPSPSAGTDTATASWTDFGSPHTSATGTAAIDFGSATPTLQDDSVSVSDSLAGALGTAASTDASPKTFPYPFTFAGTAGTCSAYPNTATFTTNSTQTTGSDHQTVTVCKASQTTATGVAVNATEGASFSGGVATFTTDASAAVVASQFTARIAWGDGTAASAGTISASGGGYSVSGSHTYAEEGSSPVTVTITDGGGGTFSTGSTATVGDAALSATGKSILPGTGTTVSGAVATFTDADPNGTVSDYSASIAWGDGTTSAGTVGANGSGGFTVSGTHTYAVLGPYTLTVTIKDAGGSPASATTHLLAFAYLAQGSFALGDKAVAGATASTTLTWWGSQWSQLNPLSGGAAPTSFKGFAQNFRSGTTTVTDPVCGGTWTTVTGNSPMPPASVPAYMAVVVPNKVTQSGITISGNIAKIVIVKTNPGYQPDPSHPGTGTVVATLCGS